MEEKDKMFMQHWQPFLKNFLSPLEIAENMPSFCEGEILFLLVNCSVLNV